MESLTGLLVPVIATLVVVILVILAISRVLSWYKRVPPNKVMIVFGRGTGKGTERRGFRIVKGGGTLVLPIVEEAAYLDLSIMTLNVPVDNVYTDQGVPVNVDATAQIKIGGDDNSIHTAAEQLLGKNIGQIQDLALQTLSGHLRAILGTLSMEEIYKNRNSFAEKVQSLATDDMAKMGFQIVSFTLKDIDDPHGYFDALGQSRTAEVKRDAQIGQAEAEREARQRVAAAQLAAKQAEAKADAEASQAEADRDIAKAENKKRADQARADSEQAFGLQTAISRQKVAEEEGKVALVQQQRLTMVAEATAATKQQELQATVIKEAEAQATAAVAQRTRIEVLAEAEKKRLQLEAEGRAQAEQIEGTTKAKVTQTTMEAQAAGLRASKEAEAFGTQATGEAAAAATKANLLAQAEGTRQNGLAEADATKAKLTSQAEGERQLAEARSAQDEINLRQTLGQAILDNRAEIAQALAAAMASMSKDVKIVQFSGNGNGHQGNALVDLIMQMPEIAAKVNAQTEALSGQNIMDLLGQVAGLLQGKNQAVPATVDVTPTSSTTQSTETTQLETSPSETPVPKRANKK